MRISNNNICIINNDEIPDELLADEEICQEIDQIKDQIGSTNVFFEVEDTLMTDVEQAEKRIQMHELLNIINDNIFKNYEKSFTFTISANPFSINIEVTYKGERISGIFSNIFMDTLPEQGYENDLPLIANDKNTTLKKWIAGIEGIIV